MVRQWGGGGGGGVLGGIKSIGQPYNLGLWNSLSEGNALVLVFGLQGN